MSSLLATVQHSGTGFPELCETSRARAAIKLESSPPERTIPIGTSDIILASRPSRKLSSRIRACTEGSQRPSGETMVLEYLQTPFRTALPCSSKDHDSTVPGAT